MSTYRSYLGSLTSVPVLIKLGRHIVRELVNKGGTYASTLAYKTLPLIPDHLKLNQLLLANLHLAAIAKRQPGMIYKYLGHYIATNFSTKERLSILMNHYTYLNRYASTDFFKRVQQKSPLWQQAVDDDLFTINLTFPFGVDFEGDLALVFELNQQPIYAISFTFIPADLVDDVENQAIFVSRVQGSKHFELIRKATRSLYDITPAALLVVALQGIAMSFGINVLVGVNAKNQLYGSVEEISEHFFDYDSFWDSFSAQKLDDFFQLPIPFPEKPLTSIKANHRSRTIRKRQFKQQVCQSVYQHTQDYFLC